MKSLLLKILSASVCLATLAATAAPLQRTDVPNDPFWVVHVDCDAMKDTTLGKFVLGEMDKPEAQKKLAAFQAIFNFDPRKNVHGLTLFGLGQTPQDSVLLVYADIDAARLTTLVGAAKDYQSTTHGAHTIHNWIDQHKTDQSRTYAAIVGNRVVFGQKESRVGEALDVLDLGKANLTVSTLYSRLDDGTGSFIFGAARKITLPGSDANAEILKHSKMFLMSLGEAQGQISATVNMDAGSEEIAQQMQAVGQGLVGLMALQKDKPEAAKLSQALSVKQEGVNVTAKLSISAEDVVGMIKARTAKKSAE